MQKRYYIAYGSNLNKEQMSRRCPNAKAVGTTVLKDYELLFKGSGTGFYLTIEKKKGSEVPCGVWEVTGEDESNLDFYEGYPKFYRKEDIDIKLRGLETDKESDVKAFIYIMDGKREIGMPSRFYMEVCLEGYSDFGFNTVPLKAAYLKSRKCELTDNTSKIRSRYGSTKTYSVLPKENQ